MSAARNQAAADEGEVGKLVEARELTDGVEQQNATGNRLLAVPLASAVAIAAPTPPATTRRRRSARDDAAPEPATLRDSAPRRRRNVSSSIASSPSSVLPATITGPMSSRSTAALSQCRRSTGRLGGFTSNFRLPPTCTRSAGAPIWTRRLASSSLWARKRSTCCSTRLQQPAKPQVARQRTVGDPGIHHRDGAPDLSRQVQQVGPELALGQHQQFGPQRVADTAARPTADRAGSRRRCSRRIAVAPAFARCRSWWRRRFAIPATEPSVLRQRARRRALRRPRRRESRWC